MLIGEISYLFFGMKIWGILFCVIFCVFIATSYEVAFWCANKSEKRENRNFIKLIVFIIMILLVIVGRYIIIRDTNKLNTIKNLSNGQEKYYVEGNIYKVDKDDFYVKIYVENTKIYLKKVKGKKQYILVSENINLLLISEKNDKDFIPGNKIVCSGKYKSFNKKTNDGGFDEEKYYYSNEIGGKLEIEWWKIKENKNPYYKTMKKMYKLKTNLCKQLKSLIKEKYVGIYEGILLGEKNDIDDEIKDLYQLAGISHILSISGLHVSLISFFIYRLLRKFRGLYFSTIVSVIFILSYQIMIGGGYSTKRAVAMIIINLLAIFIGRSYDLINSVLMVLVFTIVVSPNAIANTGFLMSYLAILAIGIVGKSIVDFVGANKKIVNSFIISFSIFMVTLPIIIENNNQFYIFSIFLNLIIVPLMTFVVAFGFLGLVVSYVLYPVGKMIIGLGCVILDIYEKLCKFALEIPFSEIIVAHKDMTKIITYFMMIFIVIIICKMVGKFNCTNKLSIKRLGIIIMILLVNILVLVKNDDKAIYVKMLDIGQGDCIFIKDKDVNILIDCGSSSKREIFKYDIYPFLKYNGVDTIDYLMISHTDTDHCNGIEDLVIKKISGKSFVKNILLPDINDSIKDDMYIKIEKLAKKNNINVIYFSSGMELKVNESKFTCVWPEKNNSIMDKNTQSMVLLYDNINFKMLFTGDLTEEGEKNILYNKKNEEIISDIDILKVGHHGSSTSSSSEFLDVIRVEDALISCGKNNSYGHPHIETIEKFRDRKINYYITSNGGQINVYSKKKGYEVFFNG